MSEYQYNKVTPEMIEKFKEIAPKRVLVGDEINEDFTHDEMAIYGKARPEVLVEATSTEEVAAVVKLCNENKVPVTPSGARTGLVGGAVSIGGGVMISLTKMNKILGYDKENFVVKIQSGVLLNDLAQDAEKQGLLYPPDPGEKFATVGGNVATNAGGMRAVKYGCTRDYVRAMTVVLPTGEIVKLGATVSKTSSGYSLLNLMIGSEGTLGIITKVTLKLQPMPPYRFDLLAVFDDPFKALDVVPKIMQAGLNPTSMEYMDNSYVRACADYIEFKGAPHYEDGIYVIITVETFSEDELDMKMEQLDELCEAAGAVEVLEADDRIWAMRRNCQESISLVSKVSLTDDVVVPVDRIAPTIKEIMHIGSKYPFPIPVKINAHIGDGNLHIVLCKCDLDDATWEKIVHDFHEEVYAYAYAQGGRLAGEHGIGAKKLAYMEEFTPAGELELMRRIKLAWDPNLILNPGKIFNA